MRRHLNAAISTEKRWSRADGDVGMPRSRTVLTQELGGLWDELPKCFFRSIHLL